MAGKWAAEVAAEDSARVEPEQRVACFLTRSPSPQLPPERCAAEPSAARLPSLRVWPTGVATLLLGVPDDAAANVLEWRGAPRLLLVNVKRYGEYGQLWKVMAYE